jgi:hypothetical protein
MTTTADTFEAGIEIAIDQIDRDMDSLRADLLALGFTNPEAGKILRAQISALRDVRNRLVAEFGIRR